MNTHAWQHLLALFGLAVALSAQAAPVGEIARVSGDVKVRTAAGQESLGKPKTAVSPGDTIITAAASQALIRLQDKSTLLVRPSSTLQIKTFVFEKSSSDRMETNLISGAMRAVSGQIAKQRPESVKHAIGTATIGIRGTDIELAIILEGQADRAGLYNYVYDGKTSLTLASGQSVEVEKELTGFVPEKPRPGEPAILILRDRPVFLQSSGFDTLLQQLTQPRIPMLR
jgi:hypothetical protein